MKKTLITSKQLAKRWNRHPGSIANMRSQGLGPRFQKSGRNVMYNLTTVERYEHRAWARGEFLGL